jgi:hypothetical protein
LADVYFLEGTTSGNPSSRERLLFKQSVQENSTMTNEAPSQSDSSAQASQQNHRVETALKLTQLLAILVSGCWALYTYLTFQTKANDASLQQQRLATQQAEITLNSQKATEAANIEQAKLAAQQAKLTFDIQNAQKALKEQELRFEVQSKRLSNENTRLMLQIQKEQRAQRAKELEYDVELKRLSVRQKSTSRFSTNFSLSAKTLMNDSVMFTFDPNMVVTSDVQVQMTVILVDVYRGALSRNATHDRMASPASQHPSMATIVCPPPGRWIMTGCPDGAITWSRVGSYGSYYQDGLRNLNRSFSWILDRSDIKSIDLGAGPWNPGDRIFYQLKFILDVKSDDFVGVSVHYLVNDATKPEDIYWYEYYKNVADLLNGNKQSQ